MKKLKLKRLFSLLLAGVLVAAALTGCGKNDNSTDDGEITFTYARAASTTSFDLHGEITLNNAFAIDKVFEPLLTFDENGEIINWLAETYSVSDDNLVYTFVLRDGLKFSDGTDVTAEDVVFSLERHLEIGGALPIEADVASVEASDEKTVVITLAEACTPFLSELACFSNGVIPKDFGGKTEEEFFKAPVGSGPFVVDSWDPAGDLVFVKNEYYWQEGKPYIDKLVYKVIEDDNQVLNQLKAGKIDGAETISIANADTLANGDGTKLVTVGGWEVEELFFNTLDKHFSDVHVRRAIALSLDREAMTEALTFGYADISNTVLPRSMKYNTNDTVNALSYNVEAAKAELAKSAYPDGFETSVIVNSGNNTEMQIAQILKASAEAIGITININAEETATFRSDFFKFNFSIMINSATADFPDADSIMAFQVDPEGFSKCYWTSYTNDKAVELLHAGQVEPNGEARAAIYAELQQILADDVPYIPLYEPDIIVAVRDNVNGISVLPTGSVRFENVTIEK